MLDPLFFLFSLNVLKPGHFGQKFGAYDSFARNKSTALFTLNYTRLEIEKKHNDRFLVEDFYCIGWCKSFE